MPDYHVTSPEGTKYKVTAPEGATQDQVLSYAKEHFAKESKNSSSIYGDAGKEFGRGVGLTARTAIEGAISPFATVANIPTLASNKMLGTQFPEQNQNVSDTLTKLRLPEYQGAGERIAGDIGKTMVGTGGLIKASESLAKNAVSPLAKKIFEVLSTAPKTQLASTVASTGTGSGLREVGAPAWAQLLASLTAGLVPGAVSATPSTLQNILRGAKSPKEVQEVITQFKNVGTTPSIGQATQSSAARGLESAVGKAPFGGAITKKAKEQQEAIGKKVDEIATDLSPKASGEIAGRAITRGIEGKDSTGAFAKDSFMGKTKETMKQLYGKLDTLLNPEKPVSASNFLNTLKTMNAPIKGAPALSKTGIMANKTAEELEAAAIKDTGGSPAKVSNILDKNGIPYAIPVREGSGMIPYSALKETRTRIGEKIEDAGLDPNINIKELRRVYAALSQDMEAAAKSQGKDAYAAFKRANGYTKARFDRLDMIRTVIERGGGPEKIFQSAISGTGEGASTFRAVMRSLPKDEQKTLVATMLRRIGRATPGKQDDVGSVFSTETFLTNWNKLSPEAKSTMTGAMGKDFAKNMDSIAKVANNLREGSKIYANPSGTAPLAEAFKTWGSGLTAVMGVIVGNFKTAGLFTGGLAANYKTAKFLTDPDMVKWIATTPNDANSLKNHIARLSVIAANSNPEDKEDILKLKAQLEKSIPVNSDKKTQGSPEKLPWEKSSLDNTLSNLSK